MKKRILFVDDQPELLRAIRRMLFMMADEWEMEFAESAKAALEKMEHSRPFDVVVSDMKMPGMDGGTFLHEVTQRHPATIRIVLSGYAENDLVFKTIGNVHQFLAKPIEGNVLIDVLQRALALRSVLNKGELVQIVSGLEKLPSLPTAYEELMHVLHSPGCSMQKVGNIIAHDVSMSLKVMQLVNSAFFGLTSHVTDPVHAVSLLGVEVMKALVVSVHVFASFESSQSQYFSLEEFTTHSQAVAGIAKEFARTESYDARAIDDAFIAGLFHDVGKLVLAANKPSFYDASEGYAMSHHDTFMHGEKAMDHTNHAQVGAYLLGLWGFRDDIVEAVAYHHQP